MSTKHWYMQFDCSRWLSDTAVRRCHVPTRAIWFDWLCRMHDDDRSGRLSDTVVSLAVLASCTPKDAVSAITDLKRTRAADVEVAGGHELTWNATVTLTNRKMRREWIDRKLAAIRQLQHRGQSLTPEEEALVTELKQERHLYSSSSSCKSRKKEPKERKPRARDPIWDTIAELFYEGCVTETQASGVGELVADLKERGATPDEIRAKAKAHKTQWPHLTCTAHSVVKNWGILKTRKAVPALAHVAPPPKPEEPPVTEDEAKALLRRKEVA